jgi:hypothetical protein
MQRNSSALAGALSAAFLFDRGTPPPQEAYRFAAEEAPAQFDGKDTKRTFSGIAYSGDKITGHWYWGDVVFDLSTTKSPSKLPMLMGHDRDKVAGFANNIAIGNDIKASGPLSSYTDEGKQVAALSDEGFPWQMSVHIDPGRVEEIGAGQSVTVNGRQFTGPITVFRNSMLREISFTPTGWDSQTSATAMSRGGQSQGEEMDPKELEQLKLRAAQADQFEALAKTEKEAREKAELEAKTNAEKVKAFEAAQAKAAAEKREADIKALFAACGTEFKDETAKPYRAMDQDTFAAISAQMQETAKKRKADSSELFSEQARGGTAGSGTAEELADAAKALVHQYAQKGQTLAVEDAVRMVVSRSKAAA